MGAPAGYVRPSTERQRRLLVRYRHVARPGYETADPDAVVLERRVGVGEESCLRCGSRSWLVEDGERSCWACGRAL